MLSPVAFGGSAALLVAGMAVIALGSGLVNPSLSALAKTFTKCSTNGFLWFGLTARPVKTVDAEAGV